MKDGKIASFFKQMQALANGKLSSYSMSNGWVKIVELPDGSYLCKNPKDSIVSNFFLN